MVIKLFVTSEMTLPFSGTSLIVIADMEDETLKDITGQLYEVKKIEDGGIASQFQR